MALYYNTRVKPRVFKPGDLVLKKVLNHVRALESNCEGPYTIHDIVRLGTYILSDLNGNELTHPWNADHLCVYYQ